MGRTITGLRSDNHNKDAVWVYLDGERFARISDADVLELGLKRGLELTPQQQKEVLRRGALFEARLAAVRLLAYRPRSRAELVRRLKTRGFKRDIIDQVIHDLERLGYVDDRGYAQSLAESLVQSGRFGPRAIKAKLRQRGLPADVVREAVEDAVGEMDEYQTARDLAQRRLERLAKLDPLKKRQRLYSFLIRRGFSPEVVRDVLASVLPAEQ